MKTSQSPSRRVIGAFAVIVFCEASTASHAASDVTVSAGATSGGSFAGTNPNVFTPTAASAVANNGTIQTSLNGGNAVTINTASAAGGNGDLTVSATVSKSAGGSSMLTLNAVRDLAVNAAISSTGGALPLVLTAGRNMSNSQSLTSNNGNITLSPTQNFTVGNNINAGTGQLLLQSGSLESSSSFTLTGSSVQTASSSAFRLHGTVAGTLSVAGALSPAPVNSTGNLQVNGDLTLQSTATTTFDLGGTSAGSTYDRINATGAVAIAGALQVSLVNNFHNTIDGGTVFTVIQGGSVTGEFIGYPNGSRITLANDYGSLRVNYTATAVTLDDWQPVIVDLTWDPGMAETGTQLFTNTNTRAGRHYFRVTTQATDIGAWRTRLTPSSGDAALYMRKTSLPTTSVYNYSSTQSGSDGFVLRDDEFAAGEQWYILVYATTGAQWSVFSGRAYVHDLGTLPFTDSNNNLQYDIGEAVAPQTAPATAMPPEGIRFYTSTVPVGTPAWSLWLNGSTRDIAIRANQVPFHSSGAYYARKQTGQMLVVPTVLGTGTNSYFMSVEAPKGEVIGLDSRIQFVQDIAFDSTTSNVAVTGAPYRVYRTQVPIDQLAWDVSTTAIAGNPNICVRKDNVPGEWDNDAYSEATGSTTDSISLVPDFLTNGTWFITVYGTGSYTFTLKSGDPVITPINFADLKTNDQTTRSGWRYYALTNIPSQVGSLGWELLLSNQVPGTMIAIRRNKVPSRWLYRTNGNGTIYDTTFAYVDYHGEGGFLQRPGHQADVWYVGIYTSQVALGAFQLDTHPISPATVGFNGSNTAVTGLAPGRWRFQRIDVPAGVEGWDVRVKNVTGTGDPRLVVRRDQLPQDVSTSWIYPQTALTWPSGYSWAGETDWSNRNYDDGDNTYLYYRRLVTAMGAPLEPGTYYVGVYNNDSTNSSSYTLESRGIGTGQAVSVSTFNYTAGSNATITNLVPREAAYYKVTIPASTPSWEFTLGPTIGEMMMCARRGAIPDFRADADDYNIQFTSYKEEVRIQKNGPERYVLLPLDGEDFLQPGDYYIAVVSEGENPADSSHTGTGTSSGILTSNGALTTANLGTASLAGLTQAVSLFGGQIKNYSFTVPAGTASLEVRLDNRVGNPGMALVSGTRIANRYAGNFPQNDYGFGGGQYTATVATSDESLITVANPAAGTYNVTVRADDSSPSFPDASANLVIVANAPAPVAFDGGTATINNQAATAWRYFQITVPAGIEGWDVRVKNLTGNGTPQLVVRRDQLPNSVGTGGWIYPYTSSTWPSGYSWTESNDWTNRYYDAGSSVSTYYRRLVMGANAPLEPGTYYVGVYNSSSTDATSYTLESRGIGSGQSLPVTLLNYAAGSSATITNLAPREAAYFKVTIPSNTPSWEFTLAPTIGEMLMCARRGVIPDFRCDYNYLNLQHTSYNEEVLIQKNGPERYVLMPLDGQDYLLPGVYYIAVVSEGASPEDAYHTGAGASSGVLTSNGPLATTNLGTASLAGLTQAVNLAGGQYKSFSFTVPAGTASLEVRLDNRVGAPGMALISGTRIANRNAGGFGNNDYGYGGGQSSGTIATNDEDLITIANPPAGPYSVIVRGDAGPSGSYPDSSANLVVIANSPVPVVFDGGTATISNQASTAWRYFQITVPVGVAGWDVWVKNVTGAGNPQLVVRRDQLPNLVTTGSWANPFASDTWPSGYSYAAETDWTGRYFDAESNIFVNNRRLVMGSGGPLEPGTYYVGVYNSGSGGGTSYTFESRGIGSGQTLPVGTLNYPAGSNVTITNLDPREAAYYKVTIPSNTPSWEFTLNPSIGEMMMCVRRGAIPDFRSYDYADLQYTGYKNEVEVQKDGSERYVLLPLDGQDYLVAGDYYIAVISEGVNPENSSRIGTGAASGVLTSNGALGTVSLGTVSLAGLNQAVSLAGGQYKSYSFIVPAGTQALEVRLDNRVGNPGMGLLNGSRIASRYPGSGTYGYGYGGGQVTGTVTAYDDNLITVANPVAGVYSLVIRADSTGGNVFPDASANLVVRQVSRLPLNYDASLNGNGNSHTASRQLLDTQKDFFEVAVPSTLGGQPVLGWLIKMSHLQGDTTLRIYKTWGNPSTGITVTGNTALIVPPFLTLGDTWFVEVQGSGLTNYTITSLPITLERPVWTMPAGHNTTFGDSGNDSGGVPLPGDQGVDIGQDDWHFFAVDVPNGNSGLLRTELQAINGNPNLYIRQDGVPTTDHYTAGSLGASLVHRNLISTGSEYGNWVPWNGRIEKQLPVGRWYLGVKATGGTNARYRLIVSTGQVTDLSLSSGAVTNQALVGRDWRYYRFTVPADAPNNWNLTFSQQLGDVVMWLRDTIPPGNGSDGLETADSGVGGSGLRSWYGDGKNQGPYSYQGHDSAGTYPFATPPLRPGHTYYVGFKANNDATFSFSSTTSGGTIGTFADLDFYAGNINSSLPAGNSVIYRIPVPSEATRLKWASTHPGSIELRLEQGTLPGTSGGQHWTSNGNSNTNFNEALASNIWPWQPNQNYYLRITNTSGSSQDLVLNMNGKNALTEDEDADGLPDAWEVLYFGSRSSYNGADDPDGDGVTNAVEFADGTIPNDSGSAKYFLNITSNGGSASKNPVLAKYDRGAVVTLTDTPASGFAFLGWLRSGSYGDDFAIKVTGTVTIPANGTYTFGINAADGARLKVNNVTIISDDTNHSAVDSFGEITLAAGTYPIELTAYEYSSGEALELFAAVGSHANFDGSFKLVGDTANGGLLAQTTSGPSTVPGLTVQEVIAVSAGSISNLTRMDELLAGTRPIRATTTMIAQTVNYLGGGSGDGHFAGSVSFPLQQPETANPFQLSMYGDYSITAMNGVPLPTALDTPERTYTLGGDGNWFGQANVTHDGVDAAQSGAIGFSQETWFETTVTGPGTVSFWWKVSSEANYDWLGFYVDGTLQAGRISGNVDWVQQSYSIGAGTHTLRWRYSTDYGVAVGSDCGWVDQISFTQTRYTLTINATGGTVTADPSQADYAYGTVVTLTATPAAGNDFLGWSGAVTGMTNPTTVTMDANKAVTASFALSLADAVDTPGRTYTLGGDGGWFGQTNVTHDGIDAGRSGAVGFSQETWFETTVTGPGTVSFWWKVSSEANYDWLGFYVDGTLQAGRISGNVDWVQQSYLIGAGTHTLRWRYSTDYGAAVGSDCGWVDQIVWSPDNAYGSWQAIYFTPAEIADSSLSGPLADFEHDGITNLMEFATGQHPKTPGALPISFTKVGGTLQFVYTRNKTAASGGVTFIVEWSDDLTAGSWSAAGVTENAVDQGATEQVTASIPAGAGTQRFVRLRVTMN